MTTRREAIIHALKDTLRITLIEEFGEILSARITEENIATMADAVLAVRLDEAAIRKDEREKCAKICKDYAQWAESKIDSETSIFGTVSNTADDLAEMILSHASAIRNGGKRP